MGETVKGNFYSEELIRTKIPSDQSLFEIEKVLKKKTIRGKKFFLVKFLYYPSKFNQYIAEENMEVEND